MLVATLVVVLLLLAVIFAPMGLTMAKAKARTRREHPSRRVSPGQPLRENRTIGRRPVDIGR